MCDLPPHLSGFPPDQPYLTEEQEYQLQQVRLIQRQQIIQEQKQRRKRLKMAAQAADASSDSDVDELTSTVRNKMDLTPAGSTPPEELVKLDPSEIGMSAGYKYLFVLPIIASSWDHTSD